MKATSLGIISSSFLFSRETKALKRKMEIIKSLWTNTIYDISRPKLSDVVKDQSVKVWVPYFNSCWNFTDTSDTVLG